MRVAEHLISAMEVSYMGFGNLINADLRGPAIMLDRMQSSRQAEVPRLY